MSEPTRTSWRGDLELRVCCPVRFLVCWLVCVLANVSSQVGLGLGWVMIILPEPRRSGQTDRWMVALAWACGLDDERRSTCSTRDDSTDRSRLYYDQDFDRIKGPVKTETDRNLIYYQPDTMKQDGFLWFRCCRPGNYTFSAYISIYFPTAQRPSGTTVVLHSISASACPPTPRDVMLPAQPSYSPHWTLFPHQQDSARFEWLLLCLQTPLVECQAPSWPELRRGLSQSRGR